MLKLLVVEAQVQVQVQVQVAATGTPPNPIDTFSRHPLQISIGGLWPMEGTKQSITLLPGGLVSATRGLVLAAAAALG